MIEYQIINYLLHTGDMSIIQENKINSEYFASCLDEFTFLYSHWRDTGVVPDIHTFVAKFPEFDVFKVNETKKYLVDTLREQFYYGKTVPIIKEGSEKLKENSFEAVDYLRSQLRTLTDTMDFRHVGHNLVKDTDLRKDDYLKRVAMKGLTGIPTGLEWLDNLTNGWQDEDFVVLGGYLGEGKSFILLYLLHAAWKMAGKKVLLISREMGKVLVGFRFDTWNQHYSNLALMKGSPTLGRLQRQMGGRMVDVDLTTDDYVKYLDELKESDVPDFLVYTNEDNEKCTLEDIESLIDIVKPDIIGIDQLSLLQTTQRFPSIRERYIHLTRNLYKLTAKKRIPILLTGQIGRSYAQDKRKKKNENEIDAPDNDQFMESNSIGEDATRTITFGRKGNIIKINVPKNRYGIGGMQEFLWDIDKGMLEVFDRPPEDEEEEDNPKGKGSDKGAKGKSSKVIETAEYVF